MKNKTKITKEQFNLSFKADVLEFSLFCFLNENINKDLNISCNELAKILLTFSIDALKDTKKRGVDIVLKDNRALLRELKKRNDY